MPKYIFFSHYKDHVDDYKQILNNTKLNCDFIVMIFDDIIDKYYKKVPIINGSHFYDYTKGFAKLCILLFNV